MPDYPAETVSVSEAARRLSLTADIVRRAVDTGQLDAIRSPGGHRRIIVDSIDRMLAERAA